MEFVDGQQILLKDKTERLRRKFEKDRSTIEAQAGRWKKESKKKPHFIDTVGTNMDSKILAAKNSEHRAKSTPGVSLNAKVESNPDTSRIAETHISSSGNSSGSKNKTVKSNIASESNPSESQIKTATALFIEVENASIVIDDETDKGVTPKLEEKGFESPPESFSWVTRLIKIIISVTVTLGVSILSWNYMKPSSFYVNDKRDNLSLSASPISVASLHLCNSIENESGFFEKDVGLPTESTFVVLNSLENPTTNSKIPNYITANSLDDSLVLKSDADDTSDITDLSSGVKDSVEEIEYADKNLDILMKQLKDANLEPLTFIPLDKIRRELDSIFVKVNRGESTMQEDKRIDYLLKCMEINPEYLQEKECERIKFRQKISEMKEQCLSEMRGYIPSSIFLKSKSDLIADGLSLAFVKRVMSKKCLWLIRLDANAISKLHIAELQSKYAVLGHSLDLVELVAVYSALPDKFMNDFDGKKSHWFDSIENAVRETAPQCL